MIPYSLQIPSSCQIVLEKNVERKICKNYFSYQRGPRHTSLKTLQQALRGWHLLDQIIVGPFIVVIDQNS